MKTIPKFEVCIGIFSPGEVGVHNNYTHKFADQKLASMKWILKKFRVYLNSKQFITFSHFPDSRIEELKSWLPNHKLSDKS